MHLATTLQQMTLRYLLIRTMGSKSQDKKNEHIQSHTEFFMLSATLVFSFCPQRIKMSPHHPQNTNTASLFSYNYVNLLLMPSNCLGKPISHPLLSRLANATADCTGDFVDHDGLSDLLDRCGDPPPPFAPSLSGSFVVAFVKRPVPSLNVFGNVRSQFLQPGVQPFECFELIFGLCCIYSLWPLADFLDGFAHIQLPQVFVTCTSWRSRIVNSEFYLPLFIERNNALCLPIT